MGITCETEYISLIIKICHCLNIFIGPYWRYTTKLPNLSAEKFTSVANKIKHIYYCRYTFFFSHVIVNCVATGVDTVEHLYVLPIKFTMFLSLFYSTSTIECIVIKTNKKDPTYISVI